MRVVGVLWARAFLIIVCTSAAVTPWLPKMQICIQMSVGLPYWVAAASKEVQTPPLAGVQLWTTCPPYAETGGHMRMPTAPWYPVAPFTDLEQPMKPIVRALPQPNVAVVPDGHASPTAPPLPVLPAVP